MNHASSATPAVTIKPGSLHGVACLPFWLRIVFRALTRLETGVLTIVLPDGRAFRFEGRNPFREATLVVRDYAFARRAILGGSLGFAEGYLAGEWDTPDLAALLEVLARNIEAMRSHLHARAAALALPRLAHLLKFNSRAGARRNIHAHYDLGNEFFARWLDPTMTYSSARFEGRDMTLDEAQVNKYRSLARRIGLERDQKVLEVGCGWGGFAAFAAGEIGARVTGITISRAQYEFARERIHRAGLSERVDIRLADYRDVEGEYDRVASIEMFEAVGERYWPVFFNKVRDCLKPGGTAGLQIITIADESFAAYRRGVDFIQRYVFPGGILPSVSALRAQVRRAGLVWRDSVEFPEDYARTLATWRERFTAVWNDIRELGFDERFRRMWTYYLSYCEAGFRARTIGVGQFIVARG